jgi:hypothetical protein
MPRKYADQDKLQQLLNRSYSASIDKYVTKNADYIDDDLEPFIVQLYTLAKTLDEKNASNAQTSGTLTQEWRMTMKELHSMVLKEKERQEAAKLAAEMEAYVDPDEEALGDFIK